MNYSRTKTVHVFFLSVYIFTSNEGAIYLSFFFSSTVQKNNPSVRNKRESSCGRIFGMPEVDNSQVSISLIWPWPELKQIVQINVKAVTKRFCFLVKILKDKYAL